LDMRSMSSDSPCNAHHFSSSSKIATFILALMLDSGEISIRYKDDQAGMPIHREVSDFVSFSADSMLSI